MCWLSFVLLDFDKDTWWSLSGYLRLGSGPWASLFLVQRRAASSPASLSLTRPTDISRFGARSYSSPNTFTSFFHSCSLRNHLLNFLLSCFLNYCMFSRLPRSLSSGISIAADTFLVTSCSSSRVEFCFKILLFAFWEDHLVDSAPFLDFYPGHWWTDIIHPHSFSCFFGQRVNLRRAISFFICQSKLWLVGMQCLSALPASAIKYFLVFQQCKTTLVPFS